MGTHPIFESDFDCLTDQEKMIRDDLTLDPQIRCWVIAPIFLISFLFGLLRHYLMLISRNAPSQGPPEQVKTMQLLKKSAMLRENGHFLPEQAFYMRKQHLTGDEGALTEGKDTEKEARNPMQDPTQMGDQMKGQITNMLPMMVIGGWVGFTFSGFVTARVPFPLTTRFKQMLQRGVNLTSLDAAWISSMSWYFINQFFMKGIYELMLGEDNQADQARAMQQQMPGGASPQLMDEQKAFKAEWEALKVAEHRNALAEVEKLVLRM